MFRAGRIVAMILTVACFAAIALQAESLFKRDDPSSAGSLQNAETINVTGSIKWKVKLGEKDPLLSAAGDKKWRYGTNGGIVSWMCPALAVDGTIYSGLTDIYALNSDGSLKWKYTGIITLSSPALGADGTVYLGSIDINTADSYLYALNNDGSLKWKFLIGNALSISSPALGIDGTVYFGSSNGYFYALNSNGSLKWKFLTGAGIESSPAIGADGTVYFGSNDCYLYALNSNGSLKWKFLTGNSIISSPALGADGTVYFGSIDSFYAFNNDGSLKWKYTGIITLSSPVLGADGTVYFFSTDDTLSTDGYLFAVNSNGSLRWKFLTGDLVNTSPAIGADGTVYFGSSNGYFYALNSDASLKWKYQIAGYEASAPALSPDGTVYFGSTDGYLYAFDTGTGAGLAESSWPKFHKDYRNTGNAYVDSGNNNTEQQGNIDGNSKVDVFDLLALLRVLSTKEQNNAADINGDGKIDVFDLLGLLKILAGGGSTVNNKQFLNFPIQANNDYGVPVNAYTAKVSAVIDHSGTEIDPNCLTCGWGNNNGKNGIVKAFNGEIGNGDRTAKAPYGYAKSNPATFFLNKEINYVGAYDPNDTYQPGTMYLNYDGHSGYDYPYPKDPPTPIVAPASGYLFKAQDDAVNGQGEEQTAWLKYHTFYIKHANGYSTWYLHCEDLDANIKGQLAFSDSCSVSKGQIVAYVGNYGTKAVHLHFEVRDKNGKIVDPYSDGLWRK